MSTNQASKDIALNHRFIEALNDLAPSYNRSFSALLKSLSKNWWEDVTTNSPTERARLCIPRRIPKKMRQKPSENGMSAEMVRIWSSHTSRIKEVEIADIADRLGVSLHWLLDENAKPVNTNSPEAEMLFDKCSLLPESRQRVFHMCIIKAEERAHAK